MPDLKIVELTDPRKKQAAVRLILEALPEWFGIPGSREEYIADSAEQLCFAAYGVPVSKASASGSGRYSPASGFPIGVLCLKQTGDVTAELAVMGVLKEHHRSGVGRALFEAAKARAIGLGFQFLQVKTVQMGRYPDYDATNRFYQSLGFQEFEVFPTLWDPHNPCQIYVMAL